MKLKLMIYVHRKSIGELIRTLLTQSNVICAQEVHWRVDPYVPNSELDDGSDEVSNLLNIFLIHCLVWRTMNKPGDIRCHMTTVGANRHAFVMYVFSLSNRIYLVFNNTFRPKN